MKSMNSATISLGKPITAPVLVPVEHKSTPSCINDPFMVNGTCYKVTAISFETPHGAVIVDDVDNVDVSSIGSALGTHTLFPKGASIVFIQVIDRESIKARLWQKGIGEIEFSCEGACVAVTVSMMLQKVIKQRANVLMGGNTVQVEWDMISDVKLTGPYDLIKG